MFEGPVVIGNSWLCFQEAHNNITANFYIGNANRFIGNYKLPKEVVPFLKKGNKNFFVEYLRFFTINASTTN